MSMRSTTAAVLLAVLVSCGPDPQKAEAAALAPPLPAAALKPLVAELEAIVAAGPQAPAEARQTELTELLTAAWLPGYATAPLAARAGREIQEAEDALWAIEDALTHDDASVRSFAAFELGRRAQLASTLPLLKRLKYEADVGAKLWVADALAKIHNLAGLPVIVETMQRADELAQRAGTIAIDVLKRLGRDPGETPTYTNLREQLNAEHATWLATGTVEGLEDDVELDELSVARIAGRLLLLEGYQLRPVDDSRFMLQRHGYRVLPHLRTAIAASEPYLRNHALEVVAGMGLAAAPLYDAVLPLLSDSLSALPAMHALGRLGDRRAVPHALARLRDADPELAAAAASALGRLGDASAYGAVEALMRDEKAPLDVRVCAAFSASLLSPGVEFLRDRLDTGDYHESTLRELVDEVRVRLDR